MKTLSDTSAKLKRNFSALRADERGAESSEVILVLVLLVIGLLAAWYFLRGKLEKKASCTGSAIDGANTNTTPNC